MEQYQNPTNDKRYAQWRRWEAAPVTSNIAIAADRQTLRRLLQEWYAHRRQLLRERYRRWTFRRSNERRKEAITFDLMGRYALEQALAIEATEPRGRQTQRSVQVGQEWQRLIRRAFYRGRR